MEKIRLDKWMWLTRIYKTRSQATEACNKNKIDLISIDTSKGYQRPLEHFFHNRIKRI